MEAIMTTGQLLGVGYLLNFFMWCLLMLGYSMGDNREKITRESRNWLFFFYMLPYVLAIFVALVGLIVCIRGYMNWSLRFILHDKPWR